MRNLVSARFDQSCPEGEWPVSSWRIPKLTGRKPPQTEIQTETLPAAAG